MNWSFIAHTVRDVFPKPISPIIYGNDASCLDVFWSPQHSMGLNIIYSDNFEIYPAKEHYGNVFPWALDQGGTTYGPGYCDLFMSFDYTPAKSEGREVEMAREIHKLMKRGGFIFLSNPGPWADVFYGRLNLRQDLVDEIKRYSMFKNEKVFVYEIV